MYRRSVWAGGWEMWIWELLRRRSGRNDVGVHREAERARGWRPERMLEGAGKERRTEVAPTTMSLGTDSGDMQRELGE